MAPSTQTFSASVMPFRPLTGSISPFVLILFTISVIMTPQAAAMSQPTSVCTRYPSNPVITGSPGQWDSGGIGRAFVMFNGSAFEMWYSSTHNAHPMIGFATSHNGVDWLKYGAPVLSAGPQGPWDDGGVYAPSVVWNGTSYLIYFTGTNATFASGIGLAFSRDGIHWKEYAGNPVLNRGPGSYDGYYVRYPSVIYDPPQYMMLYTGHPTPTTGFYNIDYAVSDDGTHWTKSAANPVLSVAEHATLVKVRSTFVMAAELSYNNISYVASLDGVQWNKGGTLLANSTSPAAWDTDIGYPSIFVNSTKSLLWYTGSTDSSTTTPAIGLAICPPITLAAIERTISTTKTLEVTTTTTVTIATQSLVTSTEIQTFTTTKVEVGSPADFSYLQVGAAGLTLALVAISILYVRRAKSVGLS